MTTPAENLRAGFIQFELGPEPLPTNKVQTPDAAQQWLELGQDSMKSQLGKRIEL